MANGVHDTHHYVLWSPGLQEFFFDTHHTEDGSKLTHAHKWAKPEHAQKWQKYFEGFGLTYNIVKVHK